ncbi:hypothetical protein D9M70_600110 [compost metagenome]
MNGGVGHHDVHSPPGVNGTIDQVLQFILTADIAGHGDGLTARRTNFRRGLLTGIGLAPGDHHPGTMLRHTLGTRQPQATAGAGDDRHFATQIKQGRCSHRNPSRFIRYANILSTM